MSRLVLVFGLLFSLPAYSLEFSSTVGEKLLIELFTSEGCSSCPPADAWLSQFKQDKRLWKSVFPLSFHVNYWDRLGWKDKYSSESLTQRQYNYKRTNNIRSVYTPGFVTNGQEWRGWFKRRALPKGILAEGKLRGKLKNGQLWIQYHSKRRGQLIINIALLGLNISNPIKRGENEGKVLKHDFVVLHHTAKNIQKTNASLESRLSIPNTAHGNITDQAIVVWVTDQKGQPIQMAASPI